MKKLFMLVLVLGALLSAAYTMPPALPMAVYGEVIGGKAGQIIIAVVEGVAVRTREVVLVEGVAYYQIVISMDDIADGTPVTFYIGNVEVGKTKLYTGGLQELTLVLPSRTPSRYLLPIPVKRVGE